VARVLRPTPGCAVPRIRRTCPRCRRERSFASSGRFRVNANGRRLDVWLLFRCEGCGRVWKLEVHARARLEAIGPERLERYLRNDEETARRIARDVTERTRGRRRPR
jgi:hypothetical protein